MTPKEFIDENYFSLTIDCKREINEIYQALKDYAKIEQLTLTDVVQAKPEKVCKGSWQIGNNCKTCKRCLDTKPS
jgi:phage host-nuclease inhibitor protein Gam